MDSSDGNAGQFDAASAPGATDQPGGGFSRRDAIARAAALGLSLASAGALPGSALGALATPSRAARGTVTRGGKLTVADAGNGTNDTLDPFLVSQPIDGMRVRSLYDHLFIEGPNFKPIPWLASEYSHSKDLKTWTFRIAPGAEFHNGTPVTSKDIAYTIARVRNRKNSAHADNFRFMRGSTSRILDKRTIRYHLQEAYADFPVVLAEIGSSIVPAASFDPKTANKTPIGSGPFVFESFTPGRSSVFTRNDNFWRDPYPFVDELEIIDIPDESARVNALIGGQVQFVQGMSYSTIKTVEAGGAKIIERPGSTFMPICLVQDQKPFADQNLRLAFAHAIDRQQIVDIVFRGRAVVGNDHPLGPGYNNRPVGIPQRTHDIEKAKFYMKTAGQAGAANMTLITGDVFAGMVDTAVAVADQVKAAGFNVKVQKWPTQTFWDQVWLHKNFYVSAWAPYGSSELMLANTTYSDGAWNEAHFRSKKVDAWQTAARQTLNDHRRTQLYTEAMRAVHDAASWIIPAYGSLVHGASKKFFFQQLPPATAGPWLHSAWLST